MIKEIKLVEEFYRQFLDGERIKSSFTFLPLDRAAQRKKLGIEEVEETFEGNRDGQMEDDPTEVADGLADQLYILFGTIIEHGLQDKIQAIFAEVHRSNMTKLCKDEKEASDTIVHYASQGVDSYPTTLENGDILVRRVVDDKILKGINYEKPKIKRFFDPEYEESEPDFSWVDLDECSDKYVEVKGKQTSSHMTLLKVTNKSTRHATFQSISGVLRINKKTKQWKIKSFRILEK